MTTSPDFSERERAHPPCRAATLDGATTIRGHHSAKSAWRGPERRRPEPNDPDGYLQEMPASMLLDRLAIPMLAVRLDGVVFYSNPALASMLGHQPDTVRLIGQRLSELLAGHSATSAPDFVTALRTAGTMVVDWLHTEGYPVRCLISETAFVRATDQVLLIGVTDITELAWSANTEQC